jgi:hypothetical protein
MSKIDEFKKALDVAEKLKENILTSIEEVKKDFNTISIKIDYSLENLVLKIKVYDNKIIPYKDLEYDLDNILKECVKNFSLNNIERLKNKIHEYIYNNYFDKEKISNW